MRSVDDIGFVKGGSYSVTVPELQQCVPRAFRANITQQAVDTVNDILSDPDIREDYKENVISYLDVITSGKYKFINYIKAVKYVSYKLRGDTNLTAYSKTFPEKVKELRDRGVTDFSSWVAGYSKGKLVNDILGRSMIPTYVLNADVYQKAINIQAQLMVMAKSEKVRSDAANSLLTHLRPPEASKIELDITVKAEDGIAELREATIKLVQAQKEKIISKEVTVKEIAHSVIAG